MSVNINEAFNKLGQGTAKAEKDLQAHMTNMDSADSADLMKLQQLMGRFTMMTNLQSNTMKTIGEAMKSTIANIR